MRFRTKHRVLKAMQSSIDVALWVIVEDKECDFDHERKTYGYLLTYVDDFLLVGPHTFGIRLRRRFGGLEDKENRRSIAV